MRFFVAMAVRAVHDPPVITLTTDFGLRDPFVGIMKGVILNLVSHAQMVDLAHDLPPGDIQCGAFCLAAATRFFPHGTIHVAVVDPGVGSSRRTLAVQTSRAWYVAPDNGILTLVFRCDPPDIIVQLENPRFWLADVSRTFHGRDIFAPVAAHLALGVPLTEFGPPVQDPVQLPIPEPREVAGEWEGVVVYVDRFGNCVTNLPAALVVGRSAVTVRVGRQRLNRLSQTYADVASGMPLALVGSMGFVEIAVRDGSAAERFGIGVGTRVSLGILGRV